MSNRTLALTSPHIAQLDHACGICGAAAGAPCIVISGGPDEDPRLDGRKPGEKRAIPHFYRVAA